MRGYHKYYEPTPEEIAAEADKIREEWTEEEELRHRTGPNKQVPARFPGIDLEEPTGHGWGKEVNKKLRKTLPPSKNRFGKKSNGTY